MKEFQSVVSKFENNAVWHYHLPVPEAIATSFIHAEDRRVICSINHSEGWHCALMPSPSGWYILINKARREKLNLKEGSTVLVGIEKDKSKYGFELPEEFEELMKQDLEGSEYFKNLTPGKQRSLIYIVTQVKNTNSRLNRSLAIFHHLKEMQGKLDFRILNQTIKDFNNR